MTGRMRSAIVGGVVVVVATAAIPHTRSTVPRIGAALPEPGLTVSAPGTATAASVCDLMLESRVGSIDRADAAPGDVICLAAGTRGPLRVEGLAGTEADPIVIVNHDGITTIEGVYADDAGIDIKSSSHLIISGAGVRASCGARIEEGDQECGIVIRGTGRGIAATARSGHIAVDHVEVTTTSHSGNFVRSAARRGTSRQEWTQHGTRVTDS